jgi:hypothetical protein
MVVVWLAFLGALIAAGVFGLVRFTLTSATRQSVALGDLGRWALAIFVGNFVLDLAILYLAMPALTGPYAGWQWVLWPLLLTGLALLLGGGLATGEGTLDALARTMVGGAYRRPGPPVGRRGRVANAGGAAGAGRSQAGLFVIGLVLVTAIVVNGLVVVGTTWFDSNAKALAAIPHIQMQRNATPLPPTDVNHIVLVTQGVAAYLGQQVIASNGQNLGSIYHTDQASYTLQSVNHHLYWIAPLIYNNVFANLSHASSPGYVVVDAEDPNVQPKLRTGYQMHFLPGALLNQDLVRHVYLSGYTDGDLADPTLEVRDDWRPYFTISLLRPTRGFTGEVLHSVLLVDPQTGGIAQYAPARVPDWVDRVIPADLVTQYLTWWGKYSAAPWFNPSGQGQQLPSTDTPELVYNNADHPVWLEPMTSSSGNDNSSTGVILFDTHDNTGRFYPLSGLGVISNVENTFHSNPHNLRNYDVGAVQLYQIYGVPTWVATFVQQNDFGETYQAVGMVDARHLLGANVVMAATKADALAQYAQQLSAAGTPGTGPSSSGQQAKVKGTVARISSAINNGGTVYYLLLQGQNRIFEADLSLSPELPLVREGDTVEGSYIDTGGNVLTMSSFTDDSIQLGAPSPSPANR